MWRIIVITWVVSFLLLVYFFVDAEIRWRLQRGRRRYDMPSSRSAPPSSAHSSSSE